MDLRTLNIEMVIIPALLLVVTLYATFRITREFRLRGMMKFLTFLVIFLFINLVYYIILAFKYGRPQGPFYRFLDFLAVHFGIEIHF